MKLLTSLMVGAFFMFGAVSAQAQDFAKGFAAYHSGDYVTCQSQSKKGASRGIKLVH